MPLNRRSCLQTAGLLAAGYFTGIAAAQAKEPVRVGVIGVGHHGMTNLAGVSKHAHIAAICDVDESYLNEAADQYPRAKKLRDLRELVARDDLDAVVISSTDHTHAVAALGAMKRGKHVFCEKPLTHTMDELQRLLAAAEQSKVVTQAGMQHAVSAGSLAAEAALEQRVLGEVTEVHAWTDRPIWPQGIELPNDGDAPPKTLDWDLWLGPALQQPYNAAYHPLRWRGWCEFGSGALGDFGPHLWPSLFWGLQLPAPSEIEPLVREKVNKHSFPSASRLTFTFVETSDRPALKLHWYDGGQMPAREVVGVDRPPPSGIICRCERGRIFIPDYGRTPKLLDVKGTEKLPQPELQPTDIHRDWIEAIASGGTTRVPFSSAAALMETCLLGNIALRTGERLTWNAENRALSPASARVYLKSEYRTGWEA